MLEKMLEQFYSYIAYIFRLLPTFQHEVSRAHTYAYACEPCEKCVKKLEQVEKVLWLQGF